jgi:hypothetical protein
MYEIWTVEYVLVVNCSVIYLFGIRLAKYSDHYRSEQFQQQSIQPDIKSSKMLEKSTFS